MIAYTVTHHLPGRIRIEIPRLKKMPMEELTGLADIVTRVWRIKGITDFRVNPVIGSVTIKYDPDAIDITAYINDMASDERIKTIVKTGVLHEMH